MPEILALLVSCLVVLALLILMPVLLVFSAVRLLFERPVRELPNEIRQARKQKWQDADPMMRERIVGQECAWRVIGRMVGACTLLCGAFVSGSPALGVVWAVAAWRVVKPIKRELRDACSYRSSGKQDQPRYSL